MEATGLAELVQQVHSALRPGRVLDPAPQVLFYPYTDGKSTVRERAGRLHFRNFSKGVLDTRPMVFYLSVTAGALFLTVRTIASPRWRA